MGDQRRLPGGPEIGPLRRQERPQVGSITPVAGHHKAADLIPAAPVAPTAPPIDHCQAQ